MQILMGIPVKLPADMPPYKPYDGSIQVKADCCGQLVWQGPEQQKMKAAQPETPILCALCVAKESVRQGQLPTIKTLRPPDYAQN